ncbi:MAG: P1 family peptidase, partial [Spirochaetaceae bacterium]|nr:P1 family peptidase [Spirochaetaceae bacterium]
AARTGVTAILPATGDIFERHLVAGGFVLNGIGEMMGLTQVLEWGWLETPILLTNTLSVGDVHAGVVSHMNERYGLGIKTDVVIPVVGETDDSFLNDVRLRAVTGDDVRLAIKGAQTGPVEQGSVGAGTGMTTFDFAGGIGSASRVVSVGSGDSALGVLVLSNFGKMRNLTIEGACIGKTLDGILPKEGRREYSYGSIIVVLATDAPLLPNQLSRIAKRAALGLGRTGSYAASTSGEIIIAFSTGNRLVRRERNETRHLSMRFISDTNINPLYEAAIEATEEAVLNAIFCSSGVIGRQGHASPPIPADEVRKILSRGVLPAM